MADDRPVAVTAPDANSGEGAVRPGRVDVEAVFEAAIDAHRLLEGVETLLVACSGGGDSVALLHLLARRAPGPRLVALHVEHGVRAEEGARDAARVAAIAETLEIELVSLPVTPASRAEADLRAARLAAYAAAYGRVGADAVVLGHTADDVAETVLLNAARGAGPAGLAALRPRRRVDGMVLVRPLLDVRRGDLRAWLLELGRTWEDDSTNQDLRITRNRIRHRVLPELEAALPGAFAALARLAGILAAEEEWWEEETARLFGELERPDPHPGACALDASGVEALAPAVRARLLRATLAAVRGDLRGIGHEHLEFLQELLKGRETARDLPGVRVRREGSLVRFLPLENRRLAAVRARPGARERS